MQVGSHHFWYRAARPPAPFVGARCDTVLLSNESTSEGPRLSSGARDGIDER